MKTKLFALALLAIVGIGSAQASVIEIGDNANGPNGSVTIGDNANGGLAGTNVTIGFAANCQTAAGSADANGHCVAIGREAYNYYGGVSLGDHASSRFGGTAVGNNTTAQDGAFAGGRFSSAGIGAVAILGQAYQGSVAIQGTTTANNSVAINGTADMSGSAALMGHTRGRANVIAFGDEQAGVYRQLTGVAAGTADTDAVNVRQLLDAIDGVEGGNNPFFAAQGTGNPDEEAIAGAVNTTVSGAGASGTAYGATVNGAGANVTGEAGTAVGHQAVVDGNEGTAFGAYSRASDHCSALGYAAECDEYGTTSFGRDGENSRLVHVADGQGDTDAANMGQVRAVDSRVTQTQSVVSSQASWFGGGANYDPVTGVFNGPNYAFISGASYNNVGDALADLDQRVYDLEQQPPGSGPAGPQGADGRSAYEVAVDNGFPGTEQEWLASLKGDKGDKGDTGDRGPQGPAGEDGQDGEDGADGQDGDQGPAGQDGQDGDQGPEGPQGPAGQDGEDGAGNGSTAVAGRNIEVQDNEDGSQTVSVTDQVKLSDQGSVEVGATRVDGNGVTIQGGPSMTRNGVDAGGKRVTNLAPGRIASDSWDAVNGSQLWEMNDRWEHRIDGLDKRISGVCAMGAAQSQAVAASANNRATHKWMAGVGFCGGQAAMHAGYSQDFTTSRGSIMSFSAGISSTGDDTSIGFGLSSGW